MKSFFYDLIVPTLLADAKNWQNVHYFCSTLVTGNWGRYYFSLNPEERTIAIEDDDGFGTVSVKLLPKDLGRFMKALNLEEEA